MKRLLKIVKVFFLSIVSIVLVILLFFQFPSVQSRVAKKALEVFLPDSLSDYVNFSRLKIGFTGKATIYDFRVASVSDSTILELHQLSVQIGVFPLLRKKINVRSLYLEGLEGELLRYKNGEMNISSLINNFSSKDSSEETEEIGSQASFNIVISKIKLEEINFSYHDSLSQVYLDVLLGEFITNMHKSRVQDLIFSFDKTQIEATSIKLGLDESLDIEDPESSSDSTRLPVIDLKGLRVSNVSFRMDQYNYSSFIETKLDRFTGKEIFVDINDEVVRVKNLELLRSEYKMDFTADTISEEEEDDSVSQSGSIKFSGGWAITADQMIGEGNNIYLFLSKDKVPENKFNPLYMWYTDLNFKIEHVEVNNGEVKAEMKGLSCNISDYISLENIMASAYMSNDEIEMSFDEVKTSRSSFSIDVNSKTSLINPTLNNTRLNKIELKGIINPRELNFFLPGEQNLPNLDKWNNLQTDIMFSGSKDQIVISPFYLRCKDVLSIHFNGVLNNAQDLDSLFVDGNFDSIVFNPEVFVSNQTFGSDLIKGQVTVKGGVDSFDIRYLLDNNKTKLAGYVGIKSDSNNHFVEGKLMAGNVDLRDASNEFVGLPISANVNYSADFYGFDSLSRVALSGQITNVQLDSVFLDTINLNGELKNGLLAFGLSHRSFPLDLKADFNGSVLGKDKVLDYNIRCNQFRPKHFLDVEDEVELHLGTKGRISLADNKMNLDGSLMDISLITPNNRYAVSDLGYKYLQEGNQKYISLQSDELDLSASSNIDPQEIVKTLEDIILSRVKPSVNYVADTSHYLNFYVKVIMTDSVKDFITYSLLDSLKMDSLVVDINLGKEQIDIITSIDQIAYNGACVNGLDISYKQNQNEQRFIFGIKEFLYKDYISNSINLTTNLNNENFKGSLDILNELGEEKLHLPVFAFVEDSVLSINLYDSLLIGFKRWDITDQEIINYNYNTKKWASHGVEITQEDQSIRIEESLTEVNCLLKNVVINHLTLNEQGETDKILLNTVLSGSLNFKSREDDVWLFKTDLFFDDLCLVDQYLGALDLKAIQTDTNNIDVALRLTNKDDYLNYTGSFGKKVEQAHKADLFIKDLAKYNEILDSNLFQFNKGAILADFDIHLTDKPDIEGKLSLKDVKVISSVYGLDFYFEDENLSVAKGVLSFNNINVRDENNNKLLLTGTINAVNYPDLLFDLSLKSDHFQLMNSTKEQNEMAYGQINVSTDISLKGPYKHPKVKALMTIHDNTDLTVTLPEKTNSNSTQDIVSFEKEEELPTDSLYISQSVKGIKDQLDAQFSFNESFIRLIFNPGASYKIITNPQSGDYAEFGLAGALEYKSLLNNLFELNGNIKVVNGTYEMSFYQMIKKEFTIAPNSTIYFTGPLSNASIDLSAKNIVKTNSVGLMAGETMGTSANEQALYNQRLPYELIFKIQGNLLSPRVSFALDLPDEYKQNSPMIASRLDRLASPENEQERNMQVFALLVTGGFIAQSSGSGTSDVAMTTARNSINSILSQQLNNITSNNIQFVDVNFGLNTYEDYARQGGQTTTDLDVQISKKMFNDRVSFEVDSRINLDGSSNSYYRSSSYNTDYKMFFDVTKSGKVKLKAYNLALYDLFDGDITNAGFGVMFSKDIEDRRKKNYVEIDSVQSDE